MKRLHNNAIGIALAALAIVVHVGTSFQYGYFRDELYFIACAHHLAWGYIDQPPLVAVAAWLSLPFGYALPEVRWIPTLAAGGAVFFACALTREFGGGRFAQSIAGIATLLLPANLFLGSTLTTTSFEPLTWTWILYLAVRVITIDKPVPARILYGIAAVAVFAFYTKYSILLLVSAIVIALLLTRERGVLANRHLIYATLGAALAVLPNVLWQATHAWPIFEVLHNDTAGRHAYNSGLVFQTSNLVHNAYLFALEQLVFTNPFLVPVWLAGLLALLFHPRFARIRFLGISYVALFVMATTLGAKAYYIAGIYPTLCAAGATIITSLAETTADPSVRGKYFVLRKIVMYGLSIVFLIGGIAFAPLVLPLFPPQALISYEQRIGIKETHGNPPRLVQPLFAEEFGWPELAQHVARVYEYLPPNVRKHTAIFADNYGDAGALDFYGPRNGLPPAISGQNSYYLWSQKRYNGLHVDMLIAVGASQAATLRASFRRVELVDTYQHPYRWSAEGPTPIFLCQGPVEPFPLLWHRFKWFGA